MPTPSDNDLLRPNLTAALGRSQVQMAELLKVSQQTINAYEVGPPAHVGLLPPGHRALPRGLHRGADREPPNEAIKRAGQAQRRSLPGRFSFVSRAPK
jgi:hypothetical protein